MSAYGEILVEGAYPLRLGASVRPQVRRVAASLHQRAEAGVAPTRRSAT